MDEINETVESLFGNNEVMESCAKQAYKQLLPSHPWLLFGAEKEEECQNAEHFCEAIFGYAQRRNTRFRGLEFILIYSIHARHDLENPASEGLAALFR